MANVNVQINTNEILRQLRGIETIVNKAIVRGLNDAAFGLRQFWLADINTFVDNPTAFTRKVFVNKARPGNLTATTFFPRVQSEYLQKITEGGVRRAGDYATLDRTVLLPVKARLNKFGNLSLGPRRWLATIEERTKGGGAFVGSPSGKGGRQAVYQRMRNGKLKLLAVFSKTVDYDRDQLPLAKTARLFSTDADRFMQDNLNKLLSS